MEPTQASRLGRPLRAGRFVSTGRLLFSLALLGIAAACGIRGELEPPRGVEDQPEPDQVTSY